MLKSIIAKLYPTSKTIVNTKCKSNALVLILGWGGSEPKNYKKLLDYYESRNVSTVLQTMPLLCPAFVRTSLEQELENVINSYQSEVSSSVRNGTSSNSPTSVPFKLYVHVYSQNGSWVYASLMRRNKLRELPSKVIIDSAPSPYYEVNLSAEAYNYGSVFTPILVKGKSYVYPLTEILRGFLYLLFIVPTFFNTLTINCDDNKAILFKDFVRLNLYFRDCMPKVPTKFIYSSGDELFKLKTMQQFRQDWIDRGIPTTEVVFGDDVPHIAAFFKKNNEYIKVLDEFFELDNNKSVK